MSRWKALVVEVHRRSLWQVLGIYLVGSWIGYQVVTELADGIGLPDWVPGLAVVLFIVGLPIVLATAFVQEGGPVRGRHAAQPADPALPRDITLLPELTPVADAGARHELDSALDDGAHAGIEQRAVAQRGSRPAAARSREAGDAGADAGNALTRVAEAEAEANA